MKYPGLRSSFLVASFLSAATMPAIAAQWVETSIPGIWIDKSSVVRKDKMSYYFGANSDVAGVPPIEKGPREPALNSAVNCATGLLYGRRIMNVDEWRSDTTGTVHPDYQWDDEPHMAKPKYFSALKQIVCPQ